MEYSIDGGYKLKTRLSKLQIKRSPAKITRLEALCFETHETLIRSLGPIFNGSIEQEDCYERGSPLPHPLREQAQGLISSLECLPEEP